jgi:L-ribulose-5-phosphate 3-epimerase
MLATATAAPLVVGQLARGAEAAAATSGPGDRSAPTCLHVFSKPLSWLSYAETAAMIAEAGFGGIDYSVRSGGHVLPERVRDDLPRAVEAAHAAGLKVEMITTEIVRAGDKYTTAVLETAAGLGVKYYRLGYLNYDPAVGVWKSLEKLKPGMRELAALNERLGMHGAYQNHSGVRVGGAMWDIHELVRDLDPRWIGCQFDIRHATVEGAESWPVTLQLLRPWIRCTDIKDFRWAQSRGKATIEGMPLGDGIVDFARYFALVRDLKITGPMSVHFEYPPFERGPKGMAPTEKRRLFASAMRRDRETLAQFLAAAGIT